jgi:hypothetical protein
MLPALLLALIHRSAWKWCSRKSVSRILHGRAPSVNLPGIKRPKWAEKHRFGGTLSHHCRLVRGFFRQFPSGVLRGLWRTEHVEH